MHGIVDQNMITTGNVNSTSHTHVGSEHPRERHFTQSISPFQLKIQWMKQHEYQQLQSMKSKILENKTKPSKDGMVTHYNSLQLFSAPLRRTLHPLQPTPNIHQPHLQLHPKSERHHAHTNASRKLKHLIFSH